MIKTLTAAAIMTAAIVGSSLAISTPAAAGEGHWSIGKGVQCRIVQGVVVCNKARP